MVFKSTQWLVQLGQVQVPNLTSFSPLNRLVMYTQTLTPSELKQFQHEARNNAGHATPKWSSPKFAQRYREVMAIVTKIDNEGPKGHFSSLLNV